MASGHGSADYRLFVDGTAVGSVEAKPSCTPLAGTRRHSISRRGRTCVMPSRHRQACVWCAGADRLFAEFPDANPLFLEPREVFPDGWEANSLGLDPVAGFRVGWT
jgi:hypothetical protein